MVARVTDPPVSGKELLQPLSVLEQTFATLLSGSSGGPLSSADDGSIQCGTSAEYRRRKRHRRQCRQREALTTALPQVSGFRGSAEAMGSRPRRSDGASQCVEGLGGLTTCDLLVQYAAISACRRR